MLEPDEPRLSEWVFADQFQVTSRNEVPAATLAEALAAVGVDRVDWLKLDTQGMDLAIFRSLPDEWRERLLVVEFEPGLLDAYRGEGKVADVLATMAEEPFWLSGMRVGRTPRGRSGLLEQGLPQLLRGWARRLAPDAPGWAELQFMRDAGRTPHLVARRDWLLAWVFAMEGGQAGHALTLAVEGAKRHPGPLFEEMARASRRAVWRAMCLGIPAWLWRRFGPRA